MSYAAKVKDGVVENVIIVGDEAIEGYIECPKGVGIGWEYKSKKFTAPIVEPYQPTEEEQASMNKIKGVSFDDVMCSATSHDMWGLSSVKDWIKAGNDVDFKFKNGNTLVLTQANFEAFEAVWVPFRASFFT